MPVNSELIKIIAEVERRIPKWTIHTEIMGETVTHPREVRLLAKCEDGTNVSASYVRHTQRLLKRAGFFGGPDKWGWVAEHESSLYVVVDGQTIFGGHYRDGTYRGAESPSAQIDSETSYYLFNFVERTHAAILQEIENRRKEEQQKQREAYRRAFEVDQSALEKAKQKFWGR